jgi:hypothetical protein
LETESWSLDIVMANLLLPKLLYFKNWCDRCSCPCDLDYDEWEEILDSIIWSFTYISQGYPRHTEQLVKDVHIETYKNDKNEPFISSNITLEFIEGKNQNDYDLAIIKNQMNIAKCQEGLNLFAKYYMSLWN